jgi:hypothetical protein
MGDRWCPSLTARSGMYQARDPLPSGCGVAAPHLVNVTTRCRSVWQEPFQLAASSRSIGASS